MSDRKLKITQKPAKSLKGDDGYRTFSIRVKDELVEELEKISIKSGRTRNEIISILLEYAVENCEVE